MGFGSILRNAFHAFSGTSDSSHKAGFVPFSERNNSPEEVRQREIHLREKYLWRGKTGWGAGGSPTVFKTEAEALAEAERLETELDRIN